MRAGCRVLFTLLGALIAATGLAEAAEARQQQAPPPGSDPAAGGPAPSTVFSRDPEGRITLRATRVDTPPVIDGVLDEPVYAAVPAITEFFQQEPDEGQPATEPTRVWLLYDAGHLYIVARCDDSQPHRIVANDMRRDGRNVTQNDNLSVIIDTFHDRRNGYEFLVNAVGGMVDNQITDERDINRDWNGVWRSRSRLDDRGWSVEMAIPFRSLRYRSGGSQVWGINIRRTVRWKNEFVYVSPVPRRDGPRGILRLSSAATLVGFEAPARALDLDLKPYALGAVKADRALDPAFEYEGDADAGLDAKYGVTKGLTADFTYHTDFAQVEDDDQQVNLTRFSLFFPEKREFFLEGQGIFAFGGVESAPRQSAIGTPTNTPLLFFSRRIGLSNGRPVPIEVGGRLTGRAGKYTIGLLDIQTDAAPELGERATNFAVVRLKRDILRRSYVGVIGTRRAPFGTADGTNLAWGVDAGLSFFQYLNLLGYYSRTSTPGATGDEDSYRARFDYDADLYGLQIERLDVGADFRPEVGFLRRTNFAQTLAQARISRRPRGWESVRKVSLEGVFDYITDGDGRLENRQAKATWRTELHSGDQWTVSYDDNYEYVPRPFPVGGLVVPIGAYDYGNLRATYTLGSQRRISGDVIAARGGFYGGDRTELTYRGRVEVTPRLAIEPGVSLNWIDLPQGSTNLTLISARNTYSFTPQMSLAAFLQYNSTSSVFSTNIRYRWEYQPGSDLFVVYNDGRDTIVSTPYGLLNRSFTVKLTRLFRF
jgi:hypothetical protein